MENEKWEIYQDFIKSEEWNSAIKPAFLARPSSQCCEMCLSQREITAHHRDYVEGVKGYCDFSNLSALCRTCHEKVHFLEHYIVKYWSKWDYVNNNAIKFMLIALGKNYEHGLYKGNVDVQAYMIALINNIPVQSRSVLLNMESAEGKITSEKHGKQIASTPAEKVLKDFINRVIDWGPSDPDQKEEGEW